MTHLRKNKFQKSPKSQKAQQFQEGLSDELRFDAKINSLWIKYRFEVKLPSSDDEKVRFEGNENNPEFKKLKDFISHFEENWLFEWQLTITI